MLACRSHQREVSMQSYDFALKHKSYLGTAEAALTAGCVCLAVYYKISPVPKSLPVTPRLGPRRRPTQSEHKAFLRQQGHLTSNAVGGAPSIWLPRELSGQIDQESWPAKLRNFTHRLSYGRDIQNGNSLLPSIARALEHHYPEDKTLMELATYLHIMYHDNPKIMLECYECDLVHKLLPRTPNGRKRLAGVGIPRARLQFY